MRLRIVTLAWLSLALAATGCSGNSTAGNSGGSTGSTAANGGTGTTTGTTTSSTTGGGSTTTTGGASTGTTSSSTTGNTTGGSGSSGSTGTTTGTTGTTGTSGSGGIGCTPGHYDLDGQSANGCEVTCTATGCTGPGGAVPMPGLAFGTQYSNLGAFSNGSNLSGPRAGASFRSVGRIADPAVGPPMAGASFKSQGGLLSK